MNFFSKTKEVHGLLNKHIATVGECQKAFCQFFERYFEEGLSLKVEKLGKRVEALESLADDKRHDIIKTLLKGALLPESRREILKVIELVDEVANRAEDIVKQIILQNIVIYDEIKNSIKEINLKTISQFNILSDAIDALFTNYKEIQAEYQKINQIELIESEVDDLESDAIKKIYSMNIDLAEKNQLKSIISEIADISDLTEDISDMLEIILVMRKV